MAKAYVKVTKITTKKKSTKTPKGKKGNPNKCPTCGKDSIYATKNPRCMYCGQALDWESYEDDK